MSKTRNRSVESSPKTIFTASRKKLLISIISFLIAIGAWQVLSIVIDSSLLLVSPIGVIKRLYTLIGEADFGKTVFFSFSRIAMGFFSGLIIGTLLALIAGRFRIAEILLMPYMVTIKSIPVASFVVIALIWINAKSLGALISFLMVLPIIYTNILEGIKSVDIKLTETARIYKMPFSRRLKYIYLPSVIPFAESGIKISLGLAWKSGVAAELIGFPRGSIGEALYYSKLYLETADLFAWTVVIVVISLIFEKLILSLVRWGFKGVFK